jgi:geranylgeranyl diphosphate synthase type II
VSASPGKAPDPDSAAALKAIETYLADCLARLAGPANLREAARYALLGGGKRLRPLLAWHSAIAAGGTGESALPAAAAVEMVHAFSLVHDDLPAMDDDDLRRGRPTLHIHAGEAMAILAGDLLLALAFGELQRGALGRPEFGMGLVHELSKATGAMIAGQVLDTVGGAEPRTSRLALVRLIHAGKTGALIRASCRMGALCGLASRPGGARPGPGRVMDALTNYGEAVGLMFQAVDDLLDVESTHEQTGKRTKKDAKAGKLTYPGLLGVKRARREVEHLCTLGVEALAPLGKRAEALERLCREMAVRGR